jgi:hypothetical protein
MVKNLLLLTLTIIVTLFMIELGLRINLIPNEFYQQMRGAIPDGVERSRLLILGDSFAQNWNTGISMYEIIADELTKRGVRILNLAKGGMGPYEYLSELETFGNNFKPDLTILFYYAGNDLTNIQYRSRFKQVTVKERFKDFFRPYLRRIYLYHFYKRAEKILIWSSRKDWSKFEDKGYSREVLELIQRRLINYNFLGYGLQHQNYFLDNILIETVENQKAWEDCKDIISEIDLRCREMDSKFLIVIIPHSTQINDHQFELFESLQFVVDERLNISRRPQALMESFCEEMEIPCLGLLLYFRERKREDFFRKYDDHFNGIGDRFAAEIVTQYLDSSGFLPQGDL